MDAFLGDLTMDCLRGVCGLRGSIGSVENTHRTVQRTFRVTNNVNSWMSAIISDLREGKRLVVPCMSTERAYQLVGRIGEELPDIVANDGIVLHTSMQSDDVKRQLVNVEQLWGAAHVRIVIYSPTVECLVAPSIRLGSNCRHGNRDRIATQETLDWLKWAYREYNASARGYVEGCRRDAEYGPEGAIMALRDTPYLRCLSEVLADRHNADTCFVAVFQDLVEGTRPHERRYGRRQVDRLQAVVPGGVGAR